MSDKKCCVCEEYLSDEHNKRIGERDFCDAHFERAQALTSTSWSRLGILELLATCAFVWGVGTFFTGDALPTGLGASVGLALVPALIWLFYIYRQDRLEPEPPTLVLSTFVLGGILAWSIAAPAIECVFQISDWRYGSDESKWIAAVAIVGAAQQFCAYLAVRFCVFHSSELDEPMDGIVYATAAGLGVATATSLKLITANEGMMPLAGSALVASTTLIHVAAALPLGLGIARTRFGVPSIFSFGFFFLVSAAVNGGLTEAMMTYGAGDGGFQPWPLVYAAAGLSMVVLIIGHLGATGMRRSALAISSTSPEPSFAQALRMEGLVWIVFAGVFAGGIHYANQQTPAAKEATGLNGQVSLALPAGWSSEDKKSGFVAHAISMQTVAPTITVTKLAAPPAPPPDESQDGKKPAKAKVATYSADQALLGLELARKKAGSSYRGLKVEERKAFGGHKTMWSHFAYVVDPPGEQATDRPMPILVRGVDIVVLTSPTKGYAVAATWPAGQNDDKNTATLEGLRIKP